MGSKADYLENKLLDAVLGGPAFSLPANVYIALFTTIPNEAGAGGVEVTGGSYTRAVVVSNATNFPAASGSSKANGTEITFPQASADWGLIVAAGVFDALSGGNMLYIGTLTNNKQIDSGDTAKFPAGSITVTED